MTNKFIKFGLIFLAIQSAACSFQVEKQRDTEPTPTPHWSADKCKAEDQGDTFGLCGDTNTVTFVCDAFVPDISSGGLNCVGPQASKNQSVGQVWCCYY